MTFSPNTDKNIGDERMLDVRYCHLLMMRIGMENEYYNYSRLQSSINWIETTLEFPLKYDPGTGEAMGPGIL